MTRTINRIGDSILGRLIGETAAGACVSVNGESCYARTGYEKCSGGRVYIHYCTGHFNCYGTCVSPWHSPCSYEGTGARC